jgi:hypothetical protein
MFPIDETVQVYPDWGVKFFNFDPDNHFGVLIQSPDVARNMTHILELAWIGAQVRAGEIGQE